MKFSFGIKLLFGLTFLVACVMALVAERQYWLLGVLAIGLMINLLGALAAVVLTRILEFPTDGGYRDPLIRAEMEQANRDPLRSVPGHPANPRSSP